MDEKLAAVFEKVLFKLEINGVKHALSVEPRVTLLALNAGASAQLRNVATIGGNIMQRIASALTIRICLVTNASLVLVVAC